MKKQRVDIIRGVPGSGKSRVADDIAHHGIYPGSVRLGPLDRDENAIIVSMDQFFVNEEGEYVWDRSKIGEAQVACMGKFVDALDRGYSVVVDNTHSRVWEFASYIKIAKCLKPAIHVEIVEIETPSIEAVRIFAARNTHNVPAAAILNMWYRWEPAPADLPITWKTPYLGD